MDKPLYLKYKTLGICFENRASLKDGINEYGLIGITNVFLEFNFYDNQRKSEKINIYSLNYLTYVLFNFIFAYSTKRCIIIETRKKQLIYTMKEVNFQ